MYKKTTLELRLWAVFILFLGLTACQNDTDTVTTQGTYTNGVFIINEGPFQNGSGTISFFNRDNKTMTNNVFKLVNNRDLGNIVQSMAIHNNKAYIVVNNANKVEVASANDLKSVGVINGLNLPRYFLGLNNSKGYVSQWGNGGVSGSVAVIDLNSNSVTKTIPTGKGANNMLLANDKVFVACNGGYENDSVLTIINPNTDAAQNMVVGHVPNSLQLDANGKLWVLCSGFDDWATNGAKSTRGRLVRINPANNAIEETMEFGSATIHPSDLIINDTKNTLYYNYGGKVYKHDIGGNALSTQALIHKGFYSLGFDPVSKYIHGADAGNFSSNGKMIRYRRDGTVVDSFQVGISPNGFYFR